MPTVPGTPGGVDDVDAAVAAAADVGYPVMLKAAAGGGGRGIRVVEDEAGLRTAFPPASREAASAFGDGRMYLERFVRRARHVEVQVLGDGADAVHLFERECSLQRRRQKVVEEALGPGHRSRRARGDDRGGGAAVLARSATAAPAPSSSSSTTMTRRASSSSR